MADDEYPRTVAQAEQDEAILRFGLFVVEELAGVFVLGPVAVSYESAPIAVLRQDEA
ncbi:hypothetical protein SAJA_04835 [Salinisphaera japonica YTM-1]|uniref:Uncharacterized protein n=1 Tax=Salinisphaera japonica YTM-1 TaxID=1209778 RepID=A0A423PYI7_9GAMM|nr:hypothetical protein SAJA_04835 [Salinisphaera japonica YTM-1]